MSYETDVEYFDAGEGIYLHVEAKASRKQTESLVRQIEIAGSLAKLPLNTIKEIEYVWELCPKFLWIVGRGSIEPARDVFQVAVSGLNASFARLGSVPPPPSSGAHVQSGQ